MSEHIIKIYSFYAQIYDFLFGKLFEHGRTVALKIMDVKSRESVLEVGVGTGLALPFYPKDAHVTGIDISREMLEKAEHKREKYKLSNVKLHNMDASSMTFADNTFDKVIASHVITVVPDPLNTLNEIKRVCKKGGEIFILNYTGSDNRVVSLFEKFISPYRDKLGLGKHFDVDELIKKANLVIEYEQRVNFMKMCRLIKCKNTVSDNSLCVPAGRDATFVQALSTPKG
jgi:phosphatidylethanolamine/phosphatidyl-N-methylethanolamine N-methyltransferase